MVERVDADAAAQERYRAPALEKGLDILEVLGTYPSGLMATELAAQVGRSLGEIFRVVQVLERRGYIGRHPSTDRYHVTSRLLEIGFRSTPAQNLVLRATPVMYALAQNLDQSCHLVIAGRDHALVAAQQAAPGATGFGVRLGSQLDFLTSCSGAVLLAFSTPERRALLLGERQTPVALESVLSRIAARGFEQRNSIRTAGVRDISFPVFDFEGGVAAALTVPYLRLIDGSVRADEAEAVERLGTAARELSLALGFSGRV